MCFGSKNSAAKEAAAAREETARREAQRQAAITAGRGKIDSAFGQFNDGYFNDFQKAFTDNYNADLDRQHSTAVDKMIAALAGRGLTASTVGANRMGDLTRTYQDERAAIGNRAVDAANQLRGDIENQKTSLYGINESIANPDAIAARATAASTAVKAPTAYSPLGEVFASALQPISAFVSADRNSVNPRLPFNKQPTVYRSNSGRVVG